MLRHMPRTVAPGPGDVTGPPTSEAIGHAVARDAPRLRGCHRQVKILIPTRPRRLSRRSTFWCLRARARTVPNHAGRALQPTPPGRRRARCGCRRGHRVWSADCLQRPQHDAPRPGVADSDLLMVLTGRIRERRVSVLAAGVTLLSACAGCASRDSHHTPALTSPSATTRETPASDPETATAQAWQQGRITIAPPAAGDVPKLTRNEALAAVARTHLVDLTVPGEHPYARFGRYTDRAGPFSVDEAGHPRPTYDNRPVWLITLDHVPIYPFGNGPARPSDAPQRPSPTAVAPERGTIGVVIDAMDGTFLKSWTD